MRKKLLSLALVLAMALSLLPTAALADYPPVDGRKVVSHTQDSDIFPAPLHESTWSNQEHAKDKTLYSSYSLTKCEKLSSGDHDYDVTVRAESLKTHTAAGMGKGQWVGVSVTQPAAPSSGSTITDVLSIEGGSDIASLTVANLDAKQHNPAQGIQRMAVSALAAVPDDTTSYPVHHGEKIISTYGLHGTSYYWRVLWLSGPSVAEGTIVYDTIYAITPEATAYKTPTPDLGSNNNVKLTSGQTQVKVTLSNQTAYANATSVTVDVQKSTGGPTSATASSASYNVGTGELAFTVNSLGAAETETFDVKFTEVIGANNQTQSEAATITVSGPETAPTNFALTLGDSTVKWYHASKSGDTFTKETEITANAEGKVIDPISLTGRTTADYPLTKYYYVEPKDDSTEIYTITPTNVSATLHSEDYSSGPVSVEITEAQAKTGEGSLIITTRDKTIPSAPVLTNMTVGGLSVNPTRQDGPTPFQAGDEAEVNLTYANAQNGVAVSYASTEAVVSYSTSTSDWPVSGEDHPVSGKTGFTLTGLAADSENYVLLRAAAGSTGAAAAKLTYYRIKINVGADIEFGTNASGPTTGTATAAPSAEKDGASQGQITEAKNAASGTLIEDKNGALEEAGEAAIANKHSKETVEGEAAKVTPPGVTSSIVADIEAEPQVTKVDPSSKTVTFDITPMAYPAVQYTRNGGTTTTRIPGLDGAEVSGSLKKPVEVSFKIPSIVASPGQTVAITNTEAVAAGYTTERWSKTVGKYGYVTIEVRHFSPFEITLDPSGGGDPPDDTTGSDTATNTGTGSRPTVGGASGGGLVGGSVGGGVMVVPGGTSTVGGFSDVPTSHSFAAEIAWAQANGIMGGYADGTFRPSANTTRQALWMVLGRMAGAYPADMAAARTWSINAGISDGTKSEGNMSRQQMITMLYRYAQSMGLTISGSADLSGYSDGGMVADYAKEALAWGVANGIITGTGEGKLNPEGTATRAHFAAFMYRFASLGLTAAPAEAPAEAAAEAAADTADTAETAPAETADDTSGDVG